MNALCSIYRCAKHQDVSEPYWTDPDAGMTPEQKANRAIRERDESIYITEREQNQERLPEQGGGES